MFLQYCRQYNYCREPRPAPGHREGDYKDQGEDRQEPAGPEEVDEVSEGKV